MTRTANNRSLARTITAAAAVATLAGLAAPANAQMFQRLDGTQDNERSFDVEQTFDAGYVTAGSVESIDPLNGALDEDFYVIKHRKDGTVEWTTRFGGNRRDRATSIHQTEDGGYIVAGHTESVVNADGSPGSTGLALLRLDPFGGVMWAHAYEADTFESVLNPIEDAYYLQPAVRESHTGDIIVVSNKRNAIGGQHPLFLRTNAAGLPIVNVSYIDAFQGSATFAGFTDLKELPDGTIAMTGFWSLADPAPGGTPFILDTDVLAMRTAPDGAPMWTARYDEAPVPDSEEAGYGLDVSPDGRLLTIGGIATRTDPTGLTSIGTEHLELDAFTGGLVASHFLQQNTPAYAATRYNSEFCTVTSGIELSGFAASVGVGPGSSVLLMPALAAVAHFNAYGPLGLGRQRLESVAVTDMTCGFAYTGPKTVSFGLGGIDQLLVKTNDSWESGCNETMLEPKEDRPEMQRIPVQFQPNFHDNWTQWGQMIDWQTAERVLCFEADCDQPCKPDFNGDGILDNGDIAAFIAAFIGGDIAADCNGDGILDNGDIAAFIASFLAGCP